MAGTFSDEYQDYIVSNARFQALVSWASEASEYIQSSKKTKYINKFKERSENWYNVICDINLYEEFDLEERAYWAKVYRKVGELLYENKLENLGANEMRPSQIADAFYLSRMLSQSTGVRVIRQ